MLKTSANLTDTITATLANLQRWAQRLSQAGYRVVAPQDSPRGPLYDVWHAEGQDPPLALDSGLPRLSPKEIWFPRSEAVVTLHRQGQAWQLDTTALSEHPTVIFGARPCDVAAIKRQMSVFLAPPADAFFAQRCSQIVLIVLGCQQPQDDACFCTSVNVDPAGTDCGDVLLTPIDKGRWAVTAATPRGAELLALGLEQKATALDLVSLWQASRAAIPPRFDALRVQQALGGEPSPSAQESILPAGSPSNTQPLVAKNAAPAATPPAFWEDTSQGCQSCGTCAFVCPTCHCFDLQEEMRGTRGVRLKNWDACTLPLFSRQASGFNPRPTRAARWQQRVEHKFRYYPQHHGEPLCTGCGRCLRLCPGGVDLLDTLVRLSGDVSDKAADTSVLPCPRQTNPHPAPNKSANPLPASRLESVTRTDADIESDIVSEIGSNIGADIGSNIGADIESNITSHTTADNIYTSQLAVIVDIVEETPSVRTLRLRLRKGEMPLKAYRAGQFAMVAALGEGEAPFCIASAPTRPDTLDVTFRRLGRVTDALSRLDVGDEVGLRAPLGHGFPVEGWQGKNLVLIGGGLGVTPLRALWQYCQDRRSDFGHIDVMLGAKNAEEHCYQREWTQVQTTPDLSWHWCVDPPATGKGDAPQPDKRADTTNASNTRAEESPVPSDKTEPEECKTEPEDCQRCFLPDLVRQVAPQAGNSVAVVCGPPIMIRLTIAALRELGFGDHDIYLTLENRMKCGLGKCGRCNLGAVHVCLDGPVFRVADMREAGDQGGAERIIWRLRHRTGEAARPCSTSGYQKPLNANSKKR